MSAKKSAEKCHRKRRQAYPSVIGHVKEDGKDHTHEGEDEKILKGGQPQPFSFPPEKTEKIVYRRQKIPEAKCRNKQDDKLFL